MATFGRPARAAALVLSATDDAGAAARAVVGFHLRALAHEEAAARTGDVEGVHQLRVATRRLRAALRLFDPLLPRPIAGKMPGELAWLGGAIGGVRDLDVLGVTVRRQAGRLPPNVRAALGPLAIAIHDARTAALEELVRTLDATRSRVLFDRLAAFGEASPGRRQATLGDVAPGIARPLVGSMLRAGRRCGAEPSAEALHRLRVRVKRTRYALEALRALGGKTVRKTLRRLEELQGVLGEHQDAVTAVEWLRQYAIRSGVDAETILAVGALIDRLTKRARRLRRRFPARWERLDRRHLDATIASELGAAPEKPPGLRLVRAAS